MRYNKFIIWIAILVIFGNVVLAFDNQIYAYWSFSDDNTSGSYSLNYTQNLDLTINGATTGETGKLNEAYSYDGNNDYLNHTYSARIGAGTDWTITSWIYPESIDDINMILGNSDGTNNRIAVYLANGNLSVAVYDGGFYYCNSSIPVTVNNWYQIIVSHTAAGNKCKSWLNGNLTTNAHAGQKNAGTSSWTVAALSDGGIKYYFEGLIDEMLIYDYAFSDINASDFWNNGNGIHPFAVSSIDINFPADNFTSYNQLSVNATYNNEIGEYANCSLIVNGSIKDNESLIAAGSSFILTDNSMDVNATYEYYINCVSAVLGSVDSENRTFIYFGETMEDITTFDDNRDKLTFNDIMFLIFLFGVGVFIIVYSEVIKSMYGLLLGATYTFLFGLYIILVSWEFSLIIMCFSLGIMWRALNIIMIGRWEMEE